MPSLAQFDAEIVLSKSVLLPYRSTFPYALRYGKELIIVLSAWCLKILPTRAIFPSRTPYLQFSRCAESLDILAVLRVIAAFVYIIAHLLPKTKGIKIPRVVYISALKRLSFTPTALLYKQIKSR